jgi:hypothetical protein
MLQAKPSPAFRRHLRAVKSGTVEKTNIIGMRKLLNGAARRAAGLSTGMTTPLGTEEQAQQLLSAIHDREPRIAGELHESGLAVLRNRRYAKRWTEEQREIIEALDHFQLLTFDRFGRYDQHAYPVYRAVAKNGESFAFRNIPWQSGGNGPQVVYHPY